MHTYFSGWAMLGRTVVVSALGYAALLTLLRLSGKRSIAKMNVFDFVVIVALGSVLAGTITSPAMGMLDLVAAIAVLLGLQQVFAVLTRRSKRMDQWINGKPTILLYRGHMVQEQLRRQRVTEEEVQAAVRAGGEARLEDVDAVVLETDGQFTILREVPRVNRSETTLSDVEGVPGDPESRMPRERRERERRSQPAFRRETFPPPGSSFTA
jgi:uncharacterized membrane protein YcaP (DUF421 family)